MCTFGRPLENPVWCRSTDGSPGQPLLHARQSKAIALIVRSKHARVEPPPPFPGELIGSGYGSARSLRCDCSWTPVGPELSSTWVCFHAGKQEVRASLLQPYGTSRGQEASSCSPCRRSGWGPSLRRCFAPLRRVKFYRTTLRKLSLVHSPKGPRGCSCNTYMSKYFVHRVLGSIHIKRRMNDTRGRKCMFVFQR